MSVGPARLAERQTAAATTRPDSTLAWAHVANHGELLGLTADLTRFGWWIVITREQTSDSGEYEALRLTRALADGAGDRQPARWPAGRDGHRLPHP